MSDRQLTSLGAVQAYEQTERGLILDCGGPRLAVAVLTPRLLRVRLAPAGAFAPRRSWAVAQADDEFPAVSFDVEERPEALILRTPNLALHVQRQPCRLSFLDAQGRSFCADAEGLSWGEGGAVCAKRIEEGEYFYGFGERTGLLDKRSRRLINWTTDPATEHGPGTDPLYQAIPVFMAVRPGLTYGVFLNNTWRSAFDVGARQPGVLRMEIAGGELDYYVMYGPAPANVSETLGQLLGTMPLPPRWALGYHQSRWSYESGAVVRELAAEFRGRDIPCDAIHFDIDYMDGYRVFTFNSSSFPEPETTIAQLRQQGFRVVTIIDPGVKADPNYFVYREGLDHGYFIKRADGEVFHGYVWPDDSVFSDYTRPEVRQWWGDLQRVLAQAGVSGVWNDMNEPVVFDAPFSAGGGGAGTIDLDAPQGSEGEQTVHAEVHNLFGYGMARASYEGMRRHLRGERPFILTRSGYAGVQRWSAVWMGDNSSWWEHLELSMPQLMNMGLSGVPFVGVDIGGFSGNANGELFARWMAYGVLTPFCRGHSSMGTERHEPWIFGPHVEAICREYLKLRYRLLPYLYSLFWEASRRGTPILRPIFYNFPDDQATYALHDQVMLGPALMAAPIYHPGREHRHVYLPAGTWYDWWSGERIEGPAHLLAHAPLEQIPLYVRGGTILPSGPEMSYTDQRPLNPLVLDIWPGEGSFGLYEDDGISFDYERGSFSVTRYELYRSGDQLVLEIAERQGAYTPPARRLRLRVHDVGAQAAAEHLGAQYEVEQRVLWLDFEDTGAARTLRFQLE